MQDTRPFSYTKNRTSELAPLERRLLPLDRQAARVRLKCARKDRSADARNPLSLCSPSPACSEPRPKSRNDPLHKESLSPPLRTVVQLRDPRLAGTMTIGSESLKKSALDHSREGRKTINAAGEFAHVTIPGRMPPKVSTRQNGCVLAYAANTSPGLFRFVPVFVHTRI